MTENDAAGGSALHFPIVGVGASAGGLAATAELLRGLGASPGVAVVVIQHPDPTRASNLVEIFSKTTPLPVHAAADGLSVEANHVYIAAQNAGFAIENAILRVSVSRAAPSLNLAIDHFFESLAADSTLHAIGVVLTGTGSDGAKGVTAIKTAGGITFAQDPSAEYRGMPDCAIATGCVDFVMSPDEIARELVQIGGHAPLATAVVTGGLADLQAVIAQLEAANEELRMAKTQLEATNEELRTANAEIKLRNLEASRLNGDLTNALSKLQAMAFDAAVAQERERHRIAADLHDHIGQSLALAQIRLNSVRDMLAGAPRATVEAVIELLAQSAKDARTLTFDLSPPVLYDLGLKAALSWLADDIAARNGVSVEIIDDDLGKPLDEATAGLVFRCVRELLINVIKHARVQTASVSLTRVDEMLNIEVQDSGTGFDVHEIVSQSRADVFGLFSVREQISRLGGVVSIVSTPSQGTRVNLRVPLRVEGPTRGGMSEEES